MMAEIPSKSEARSKIDAVRQRSAFRTTGVATEQHSQRRVRKPRGLCGCSGQVTHDSPLRFCEGEVGIPAQPNFDLKLWADPNVILRVEAPQNTFQILVFASTLREV